MVFLEPHPQVPAEASPSQATPPPVIVAPPTEEAQPLSPSAPVRLWIYDDPSLRDPKAHIVDVLGATVTPYSDAMVAQHGGVEPDGPWQIADWTGGGQPGAAASPSDDKIDGTTFLYGHSAPYEAIFNVVRTLKNGTLIVIETADGSFYYYEVTKNYTVDKLDLKNDPVASIDEEGRLVLVSCYRPLGWDENAATTDNTVVIAELLYASPPSGESEVSELISE